MIFFDLDGTLVDHELAERLGAQEFYDKYKEDLLIEDNEFPRLWISLSHAYYERFLAGELSFQEQRRMRIKLLFGESVTDQKADQLFMEYLHFYKENWTAFPDAAPCLQQLKKLGYKLGVISNGDYQQQVEKLDYTGLHSYFDQVNTSSELGISKPNKDIFIKACKQANARTEECIYIGDNLEIDALASNNAGMNGVWLNRKKKPSYACITEIHNLDSLIEKNCLISQI
ncbi:HAD family hydrolase [Niallia sp. 03133]|uniref:HAD family hydrolase n=1 Tax=Niallia sp. 03133 TaxID=3458060 RepID=UPI004044EC59